MLANRSKEVIAELVSSNQSAFLPGRCIQDNLLLAHEMVREYNRNHVSRKCAIKVDIKGAYDSVNWHALMLLTRHLGSPEKTIAWIGMCN